jgi:hypothetical protein
MQVGRGTMRVTRTTLLLLLSLSVGSSAGNAAQDRLVERVRNTEGGIALLVLREFSPADLSDLVAESDLIARVLVAEGRSRLSRDERRIETDYSVQILETYFQGQTVQSDTSIVVSRPGGVLTIDGHAVTGREPDFPLFQAGEEYVRFDPQSKLYIVPHGAQGAFREVGGFAEQVSSEGKIKSERGKLPSAGFAEEIRELASKP